MAPSMILPPNAASPAARYPRFDPVTETRLFRHSRHSPEISVISVWSLLGVQDDVVRGSLERFGLEYCEIAAHLIARAAAQKDLDTFSGVPVPERNHSRRSGEPTDL
jgi:hypothetical protein